MLEAKQKKQLKSRAHNLNPVVQTGNAGLTANVLSAIHEALDHHELIKVKVSAVDRATRDQMILSVITDCNADLVQRIGNIAVLYRANPDKHSD